MVGVRFDVEARIVVTIHISVADLLDIGEFPSHLLSPKFEIKCIAVGFGEVAGQPHLRQEQDAVCGLAYQPHSTIAKQSWVTNHQGAPACRGAVVDQLSERGLYIISDGIKKFPEPGILEYR
jgi:hypothetical protein